MPYLILLALAWAVRTLRPHWGIRRTARPTPTPAGPIRLVLIGQRRASWDRDEPPVIPALNTRPACSAIRQPFPLHVVARTILPVPDLIRGHVRAYTRQQAEENARQAEENARQIERRAAAFAAALDLPDPIHWLDSVTTDAPMLTGVGAR